MKLFNKIPNFLFMCWSVIIFGIYNYFAFDYFFSTSQDKLFILLVSAIALIGLVVFGVLYFFYKKIKLKKITLNQVNYSAWKITIWTAITILISTITIRTLGNALIEKLDIISFIKTILPVIYLVLSRLIFLSTLTILSASIGKKIFNLIKFNFSDKLLEFIFSFGLGLLIINYCLFFILTLGWLYFWSVIISIIILTIHTRKEIYYFFKNFSSIKINFKNDSHYHLLAIIFSIINLLAMFFLTFHQLSFQNDDLNAYFNAPKLYTYYHHLIPFYNASPTVAISGISMALYAGINTVLGESYNFQLTWFFMAGMLTILYLFTARFFSKPVAGITLFFSTLIPWHYTIVLTQKPVYLFAFITTLSILSLFLWLNEKEDKWLYLSALFLGYATSVKLDGILLIATICLFFLLIILKNSASTSRNSVSSGKLSFSMLSEKSRNFKTLIKPMIVFGLIIFTTFLPTAWTNTIYYNNPLIILETSSKNQTKIFNQNKPITLHDLYNQTNFDNQRSEDFTIMWLQNHFSQSKIINTLWVIWNVTVNPKGIGTTSFKINPYLIIFLPLFVFYFFRKKYYQNKNILSLTVLASIFFIIWLWQGKERAWYGIGFFYPFFIFCAIAFRKITNKTTKLIIFGSAILLFIQIFIKTVSLISYPVVDNEIYYSDKFLKKIYDDNDYQQMSNFINQEVIAKNPSALVLMIFDESGAYIQESDKHLIADLHSMYWGKIVEEASSLEEIHQILKQQGITHIYPNTTFWDGLLQDQPLEKVQKLLPHITQSSNPDDNQCAYLNNLAKELKIFYNFKDKYLTQQYCSGKNICLYRVNDQTNNQTTSNQEYLPKNLPKFSC